MLKIPTKKLQKMCYTRVYSIHVSYCNASECDDGFAETLQATKSMHLSGHEISRDAMYALLQGCLRSKDLASCRLVRSLMVSNGLDFLAPLADSLIRTFALCRNLEEADGVFIKVSRPSVYTWNAIMSAHANAGDGNTPLKLYVDMQKDRVDSDKVTFLCLLKACSCIQDLDSGRLVHSQFICSGINFDSAIGNTIIDMYIKGGSLIEARTVFDQLPNQDLVSWSVMIGGYFSHECYNDAVKLFELMQYKTVIPNQVILASVLKACGNLGAVLLGRLIHHEIEKLNLITNYVISSALINMYFLFGITQDACKVFEQVENKDVHIWSEMIAGYTEHGLYDQALFLMKEMQHNIEPDKTSCLRILKACCSSTALRQAMLMHDQIIRNELEQDTMIGNTIVNMYAKCGQLKYAESVFHSMENQDVVSWSAMINGCVQNGDGLSALTLFQKMQEGGIKPSKVSFLGALKACGLLGDLSLGRVIHDHVAQRELMSDVSIGSAIIDMYAKCGSLKEAHEVFDCLTNRNVIVWGALIAGYAQYGYGDQALELFLKMHKECIKPDKVIFSSALQACACTRALEQGRVIHDQIIRDACESHLTVANTLVDFYVKCGSADEGRKIFDTMDKRDFVTWGAMIVGYAEQGFSFAALQLFQSTEGESIELNRVAILGLLRACNSLGSVNQGHVIYNEVVKVSMESDLVVCNTLLDLYSKSGYLKESRVIFDRMLIRDAISWSVMISGYALSGEWTNVRKCLEEMQKTGIRPDDVTFTNVLMACSHSGLLQEGNWFFRCMNTNLGIKPSIEHYTCLIDIFSRAGHLMEAEDLLQSIPIHPDAIIWISLFTSCRAYGNKDLSYGCFTNSLQIDSDDVSNYIMLLDIECEESIVDKSMWLRDSVGYVMEGL